MLTELFEIELFICIKMDLELNNLQKLMRHRKQTIYSVCWSHDQFEDHMISCITKMYKTPFFFNLLINVMNFSTFNNLLFIIKGNIMSFLQCNQNVFISKKYVHLFGFFNGISTFLGYLMPNPPF